MCDKDYNNLINFIQTNNNISDRGKSSMYSFINSMNRFNIVLCEDCVHHNDCQIERILPTENYKFCSFGKRGI